MKNTYTAEQATTFLREHYRDAHLAASELGAGEWSQAFAFSHDGRDLVLRLGADVDDFARDQLAARYAGPHLPIPKVLELGPAPAQDGYFAVSERVYGDMLDHLDGPPMHAMQPELFKTLDAIRQADISHARGYGIQDSGGQGRFSTWPEYLLAVDRPNTYPKVKGWRERLAQSPAGPGAFDRAYGVMRDSLAGYPGTRFLIHSDLLNRNVLVQDGRISGVIDWANAMYGDFVYDLAQFIFWAPWYKSMRGIDWAAGARRHYAAIGLEVPGFDQRLLCCLIHIGLGAQLYHAFTQNWKNLAESTRRTLEVAGLLTKK